MLTALSIPSSMRPLPHARVKRGSAERSALGYADTQLGHLNLKPWANVTRLFGSTMRQLGHAGNRVGIHLNRLKGVVIATPTRATMTDSLWREHEKNLFGEPAREYPRTSPRLSPQKHRSSQSTAATQTQLVPGLDDADPGGECRGER